MRDILHIQLDSVPLKKGDEHAHRVYIPRGAMGYKGCWETVVRALYWSNPEKDVMHSSRYTGCGCEHTWHVLVVHMDRLYDAVLGSARV